VGRKPLGDGAADAGCGTGRAVRERGVCDGGCFVREGRVIGDQLGKPGDQLIMAARSWPICGSCPRAVLIGLEPPRDQLASEPQDQDERRVGGVAESLAQQILILTEPPTPRRSSIGSIGATTGAPRAGSP
jgi:hypothetical protein